MFIESKVYFNLGPQVPTWSDGTDEEIAAALEAHYNGDIDLTDYWTVGDKRLIHLNNMETIGPGQSQSVSETHHADDYEFVIIGMNHDDLTTPIGSITKAAVTVQMDRIMYTNTTSETTNSYDAAQEQGYIDHKANVPYDGDIGWGVSDRRVWCHAVFKEALPQIIKNSVKRVNKKFMYSYYKKYNKQSYNDSEIPEWAFLLSAKEVFGSDAGIGVNDGNQYAYFANDPLNRIKKPKYQSNNTGIWWLRTLFNTNGYYMMKVSPDGSNAPKCSNSSSNTLLGICPAFCL